MSKLAVEGKWDKAYIKGENILKKGHNSRRSNGLELNHWEFA